MDLHAALLPPSAQHLFGTDVLGRDLLSRVVSGATVSLGVSFAAVAMGLLIGGWAGTIAGYFGGWRDRVVSGMIDLFLCFPAFFLILSLVAVLGPGIWNLIFVLALTGWMGIARLVRSQALSLREREYILAAKVLGLSDLRILMRHVLPNAVSPIRVSAVLALSGAIMTEAGLSFLGLGVQPPVPSWGNLLMDAKSTLGAAWWTIVFPGGAVFLTVLSLQVLGEALTGPEGYDA